jgi:hypothetical protein
LKREQGKLKTYSKNPNATTKMTYQGIIIKHLLKEIQLNHKKYSDNLKEKEKKGRKYQWKK